MKLEDFKNSRKIQIELKNMKIGLFKEIKELIVNEFEGRILELQQEFEQI